jgi:CRP/FNR family transcriptional regulator, cyclic AMP receptor protein
VKRPLASLTEPTSPSASSDDEALGFFSSLLGEHDDGAPAAVTWTSRAVAVRAKPFDGGAGLRMFGELWGKDRFSVALEARDMDRLAHYLRFYELPAKVEVIGQDEQGDYMIVILGGTIAVDRVQPWGGRARLAEARAGDMLGEMSLIDGGARFSACTTLTPCTVAVLDAPSLDQMAQQDPRLALALLASLSRRLSLRLRQVSSRLSALLSRP